MSNYNFVSEKYFPSTRNCIYKAHDKLGNRNYIGRTEQKLIHRIHKHISDSRHGTTKFHRVIRKYGIGNIDWDIIYVMENQHELTANEKSILAQKEREFIQIYDALGDKGMNMKSETENVAFPQHRFGNTSSYKINEKTALEIIAMLNEYTPYKTIAAALGVPVSIVDDIAGRKTWRYLGYNPHTRPPKQMTKKEKKYKSILGKTGRHTRYTQPFNSEFNPDEAIDRLNLGPLVNDVIRVKKMLASGAKLQDLREDKKLYLEITQRKKYMCIAPELNKLIYCDKPKRIINSSCQRHTHRNIVDENKAAQLFEYAGEWRSYKGITDEMNASLIP